jgi:8-oxo-dGTP diphosphatase
MALPRYCSHCAAPLPGPPPVTCPGCDTSHWLDAKPCAGALVSFEGRLLLVRRAHAPWRGLWDIPGGFCGSREHPADAAVREVREETGLEVKTSSILGMWIDSYAPEGLDRDKVTLSIYFHATAKGSTEIHFDPNEVAETRWFAPHELPGEVAFPGHVPEVLRAWARTTAGDGSAAMRVPSRPEPQAARSL